MKERIQYFGYNVVTYDPSDEPQVRTLLSTYGNIDEQILNVIAGETPGNILISMEDSIVVGLAVLLFDHPNNAAYIHSLLPDKNHPKSWIIAHSLLHKSIDVVEREAWCKWLIAGVKKFQMNERTLFSTNGFYRSRVDPENREWRVFFLPINT